MSFNLTHPTRGEQFDGAEKNSAADAGVHRFKVVQL